MIADWLDLAVADVKLSNSALAAEVVEFLSSNPTPEEVLAYQLSEPTQNHLRELLDLNEDGLLTQAHEEELDEFERLDHIIIMLKSRMLQSKADDDLSQHPPVE